MYSTKDGEEQNLPITNCDWRTRVLEVQKPNISEKELDEFSIDDNFCVRKAVAENENTSLETLKVLLKDVHWCVRRSAERNPNCPEENNKV